MGCLPLCSIHCFYGAAFLPGRYETVKVLYTIYWVTRAMHSVILTIYSIVGRFTVRMRLSLWPRHVILVPGFSICLFNFCCLTLKIKKVKNQLKQLQFLWVFFKEDFTDPSDKKMQDVMDTCIVCRFVNHLLSPYLIPHLVWTWQQSHCTCHLEDMLQLDSCERVLVQNGIFIFNLRKAKMMLDIAI